MELKIKDSCVGCGACVKDCPMGILSMAEGRPVARADKAAGCIACQHCLVVCPVGALSLNGIEAKSCTPVDRLTLPTGDMMRDLLKARRSIRQFASENLPKETIADLLETLKNVPTGCNIRHLTFRAIASKATLDTLRERMTALLLEKEETLPDFLKGVVAALRKKPELDPFFRGAPHLLIVQGDPEAVTPQVDCDAACAYFDMLLQGSGLGTTWCGFLHIIVEAVPEVAGIFGLPKGAPFYAMLFGRPAVSYARTVNRTREAKVEIVD